MSLVQAAIVRVDENVFVACTPDGVAAAALTPEMAAHRLREMLECATDQHVELRFHQWPAAQA